MKRIPALGIVSFLLLGAAALAAQQPKFELADLHVSPTPRWFAENYERNITGRITNGVFVIRDASLFALIQAAYGVTEDMVAGGPGWLKLDLYDVIAKVPDGTTDAQAKMMLQGLLAERFGLVARRETHPMPRYVLSVGKGGSKMKPAAPAQDSGCQPQRTERPTGPITPATLPNQKFTCHNLTSAQIVENLRQMAGAQVNTYLPHELFDSTGLDGKYDFDLEFTPISVIGDKGADGITLFDAVSSQLGLNLGLKDVPVPALVIDKVNRNPAPNPPAVKNSLALSTSRFEVASIKPLNPNERPMLGNLGGDQVRFLGTLKNLMVQAFMIYPNAASDEIFGLPSSADSQVWIITAKLPSTGEGAPSADPRPQPPPRSIMMEMLRGLLADQFELKTHTENREVTVYAMTLPGKPKMTQADGTELSQCPVDPTAKKPFPNMGSMVSCRNMSMAEFAMNLNQATGFFDHPIVDETGLKGGWNFKIGWSRSTPLVTQNAAQGGQPAEPTGLTSYEAVERQMGVKLVKKKRPMPVIVVDHVDEKPVE